MNITSFAIFVPITDIISNSFDDFLFRKSIANFGTVVANQLVKAFYLKDGTLKLVSEQELWYWRTSYYSEFLTPSVLNSPFEFIFIKLETIFKSLVVFSIMSIFLSIFFHISTISIVSVYIVIGIIFFMIVKLYYCIRRSSHSQSNLYAQFPWIGVLGAYLRRKGKSDKYVLLAFFGLFWFSIILWYAAKYFWTDVLERTRPYYNLYSAG